MCIIKNVCVRKYLRISGHNFSDVLVPEWFFIIGLQLLPTHSTHFATFEFQKT